MAVPKIWRKISEQYNLEGSMCSECSGKYFPPRNVCRACGSIDMNLYKFSGKGVIVTFTVIRTPLSDPEGEISEKVARNMPYVLAIIKLDEGPMLTAEIVDTDAGKVRIGDKAEMVFRKILEKGEKGVIQYGYKFRIADD